MCILVLFKSVKKNFKKNILLVKGTVASLLKKISVVLYFHEIYNRDLNNSL